MLPKRSTPRIVARIRLRPTSGSGMSSRTSASGSIGGPSSASGTPSDRCAAAGEKRSRPWKVRETDASAYAGFASSCASTTPPLRSAAGSSRPLSGPTYWRPSASRSASGRRPPPTPGSTTARCTPTGMYGSVLASTSAPWRTRPGRIPCVTSMISRLRRDPLDHAVTRADEVVLQPEVGQERDERGTSDSTAPGQQRRRPRRARPRRASRPRRATSGRRRARRPPSAGRWRRRGGVRPSPQARGPPRRRRARRRLPRAAPSGAARPSGRGARKSAPSSSTSSRRAPSAAATSTRPAGRGSSASSPSCVDTAGTRSGSSPCVAELGRRAGADRRKAPRRRREPPRELAPRRSGS